MSLLLDFQNYEIVGYFITLKFSPFHALLPFFKIHHLKISENVHIIIVHALHCLQFVSLILLTLMNYVVLQQSLFVNHRNVQPFTFAYSGLSLLIFV